MKEVCAITGGTSGIGKGLVKRFTADGFEVVFCGRNESAGAVIAAEYGATYIKADVTIPAEIEAFFAQIKEQFGRLDVLIVNSGMGTRGAKQCDLPLDDYKRVMDVNLNGAWYTLKYGVKLIEECGRGGRVVTIGSLAGLSGTCCRIFDHGAAHYGVSKHALHGLTKIMALEYAPAKIRINAVAPTVIETETVHRLIDGDVTESLAKVGLSPCNPLVGTGDSLPQVEDVTGVVAFLCGPESKFINGAVVPIDGGYSCN